MRLAPLITLFLGLVAVVRADNAADIARIHTEAIGGKQIIEQLQTLRATGHVNIDGRVVNFQLVAERPNQLRLETLAEGRRLIQATDGIAPPWQFDPDGKPLQVRSLEGEAAKEFTADAEFDDPLVDPGARGYAVDFAGEGLADGRPAIRLLVTRQLVDSYELLVDAETYFIVRKIATRVRDGREVKIETVYDDFRPVAGVIMPHRYVVYAKGRKLHETILESVEPNSSLPERSFQQPVIDTVPD